MTRRGLTLLGGLLLAVLPACGEQVPSVLLTARDTGKPQQVDFAALKQELKLVKENDLSLV